MQSKASCPPTIWLILCAWLAPMPPIVKAQPPEPRNANVTPARSPWTTSRLTGTPDPPSPYLAERIFGPLSFKTPVDLAVAPGGDRMFVVELEGKVFSFPNAAATGDLEPAVFFDLRSAIPEAKMAYGLTFHPDFAKNRYCYLCYVLDAGLPDGSRVSRFTVDRGDPPRIEPGSEQILLTFRSGGHNGGCLKFGPDGFLYISTGDAEAPFPPDPLATGQDISDLLSSILRIDVDRAVAGKPYAIPPDNPFVDQPGARGEVWAYGLRNPWKMSFDPTTGELWLGDVGWELREMIYRVERGGNYGWAVMEGSQPVLTEGRRGPTPVLPPVVEHVHTEARSITGGFVYRGGRLPELTGKYLYGDFETGKIWGLVVDGTQPPQSEELVDTTLKIICFGLDHSGELYFADYDKGGLYRLVPNPDRGANQNFPRRLSETGLFANVEALEPAPGVVGYGVRAEPWTDGAIAVRHMALPGDSQIESRGAWLFPPGAVLAKTLSLPAGQDQTATARRLETQLLHFDGHDWRGYSYAWNDAQTDAELVDAGGFDRTLSVADADAPGGRGSQNWHFASRAQCVICHNTMAGSVLGFTPVQLNLPGAYASGADDQLDELVRLKVLSAAPETAPAKMVDPRDASAELGARARSYLHANCSHCHRRHGGGTAAIELPFELPLEKTNAIGARPTQGTFGIHGAKVIAPHDPYRSVLYYRMAKLGRGHMPHLGSQVIDEQGLKLIRDWISQMPGGLTSEDATDSGDDTAGLLRQLQAESAAASADVPALNRLLATPHGALALASAVGDNALPAALRARAIAAGAGHADLQIAGLFERFVPEEQRPKRLGDAIRAEQILAIRGDAEAGKRLFFETAAIQCKNCHRIRGQGVDLGPDLSQIGKKLTRIQLLESILQPSKQVDPKFTAYLIETTDGLVHTGLLVERTSQELVLKDSQNKVIRVPVEEVETAAPQQKSLMPDLLLRDMTAREAADLLDFLSALQEP